jgi:hypothetical protein
MKNLTSLINYPYQVWEDLQSGRIDCIRWINLLHLIYKYIQELILNININSDE